MYIYGIVMKKQLIVSCIIFLFWIIECRQYFEGIEEQQSIYTELNSIKK